MEFKEMTCPFCKGELKIPEELSTCICMYCGKKIEIANTGKLAENCLEYEKFCDIAMNEGASIVLNHLNLMKSFKANLYEDAFKRYLEVCMATIQALDRACGKLPYIEGGQLANSKYKAETEQQLIELWVMRVLDDMEENCKIKRAENGKVSNSRKVDELRFIMALYTVPMIRETKLEAAEAIAELITKEWESRYPLQKFSKADYAEIRDGFRKRKLCFITTAACDYLGKTDDCSELQAFRAFRDTYLLKTDEGKQIVEEYYAVAPSIVTVISVLGEQDEIYMSLWQNYLNPCLEHIKNGEEKQCTQVYVDMVNMLTRTYVLS